MFLLQNGALPFKIENDPQYDDTDLDTDDTPEEMDD
jgi:hypothetical protein